MVNCIVGCIGGGGGGDVVDCEYEVSFVFVFFLVVIFIC